MAQQLPIPTVLLCHWLPLSSPMSTRECQCRRSWSRTHAGHNHLVEQLKRNVMQWISRFPDFYDFVQRRRRRENNQKQEVNLTAGGILPTGTHILIFMRPSYQYGRRIWHVTTVATDSKQLRFWIFNPLGVINFVLCWWQLLRGGKEDKSLLLFRYLRFDTWGVWTLYIKNSKEFPDVELIAR